MVERIRVDLKKTPLNHLLSHFHSFKKEDELYPLREKSFHFLKNSNAFQLCKENWKNTPFFEHTQGASFDFFSLQEEYFDNEKNEKLKEMEKALNETFPDFDSAHRLVFVNGIFNLKLSYPLISSKIKIFSISDLFSKDFLGLRKHFNFKKGEEKNFKKIKAFVLQKIKEDGGSFFKEGFSFLNDALFVDGSVVYFEKEAKMETPIHLIFVSEMDLMDRKKRAELKENHFFTQQSKNFIFFDSFSKASVIESYISFSKSFTFTNSKTYFTLGKGSQVDHIRFQKEDIHSFHIGGMEVLLEAEADLRSFYLSLGAFLSHLKTDFNLSGRSSAVDSLSIYFPKFSQHMNHSVFLHHRAPFSSGTQFSKGILVDDSKIVFNGKVKIEREGEKAYSNQISKNLILSQKGDIQTNPQLEVHADDVSATHGATVGRLNEDEIFYLRSRGLPYRKALSLLLEGFIQDIFLKLNQPLKRSVENFFKGVLVK